MVRIGRTAKDGTGMKSTQERLSESYCRPKTEDETERLMDASRSCGFSWNVWIHEGNWLYFVDGDEFNLSGELEGRTEIHVQHFIDLLNDRIAPWRLEEDGFDIKDGITYFETVAGSFRIEPDGEVSHIVTGRTANVDTYTDLLTLIRLIG